MADKRFRVFATCHIGEPVEQLLRDRSYELEIYRGPGALPKKLILSFRRLALS